MILTAVIQFGGGKRLDGLLWFTLSVLFGYILRPAGLSMTTDADVDSCELKKIQFFKICIYACMAVHYCVELLNPQINGLIELLCSNSPMP